jgi:hypothetical protein
MTESAINLMSIGNSSKALLYVMALIGVLFIGWFLGSRSSGQPTLQNQSTISGKEIVVSDKDGLVFKSESGQPLAKIGKDDFGTYFQLFGASDKPLVSISTTKDKGAVVVGSQDGSYVHVSALDKGGNITLINKYGKQVLELSSGGDGKGTLVIGEPKQGYKVLELGSVEGPRSKGVVQVFENGQTSWSTP